MLSKTFFSHPLKNQILTYEHLIYKLNLLESIPFLIKTNDLTEYYVNLIAHIINNSSCVLLDQDFQQYEMINAMGNDLEDKSSELTKRFYKNIDSETELLKEIENSQSKITLFTSGTSGVPKKVLQTVKNLLRGTKKSDKFNYNIWALAYNPTHMAGIQVFFQCLLNLNTMHYVFNYKRAEIINVLTTKNITNISATPTFYRLLLPSDFRIESVKRVVFGGEKSDDKLYKQVGEIFPEARISNIYASTEAGYLFKSFGDVFETSSELSALIKIKDDELLIHTSLLGETTQFPSNNDWYATGDKVEIICNQPLRFKFLGRAGEMINVGGYKINPYEVEEAINLIEGIDNSKVYGRKNSVLGNILCCDILVKPDIKISQRDITDFLKHKLQSFKIPRIYNMVQEIEFTRTGKQKRA